MPRLLHFLILAIALSAGWIAVGQELEFPISPTPVGSGARAAGMSDAFIAVADDATAASWNPAGLVQLERPEISIVGSFNSIRETFDSMGHPEFDSTHRDLNLDVNFMGFVYPLPVTLNGRNVTLSLTYHQKYDLSRNFDVDFDVSTPLTSGGTISVLQDMDFKQEGSLGTITPSVAFELSKTLSLGLGLNVWRNNPINDNGWTQTIQRSQATILDSNPLLMSRRTTIEKYKNVSGENFTIGVLWNATEKLNLGFRYESALDADASYTLIESDPRFPTLMVREKRKLKLPPTIAFGAAYRFNDRFTMSMDVSTTDWDDFYVRRADGSRFSLVDASDLDDPATAVDFDRTWTARMGAEYVFLPEVLGEELDHLWTLRGGLLFDQEPASGRSTTDFTVAGDGSPDNFYGASIGLGLLLGQRVNIDLAYQARYGPGVNSDFIRGVPGFEEDVLQHRILFSTVIYF